jgi:hypothetical protein
MRLISRNLEPADIEACFAQLCNPRAYDCYDPDLLARVPQVLRSLLEAGTMTGDIAEDLDRPAGSRCVGLAAGVFVTDAFVHKAQSIMPPYVRAQLVEMVLQNRSPVLSAREVRAGNKDLNLFILEDMLANRDLTIVELREVKNRGIEAGLARFRCFRLKSWLSEFYEPELRPMFEAAGASVRRDYSECLAHGSPRLPDCQRPFLIGVTREEALQRDGTVLSMLFMHTPRRFSLRPTEQTLLRRSLLGETDEELARAIGISLSAVKKRWHSVYQRIERSDPDLIPDRAPEREDHTRGSEKRRHLLNYLRQHPEELQPNVP